MAFSWAIVSPIRKTCSSHLSVTIGRQAVFTANAVFRAVRLRMSRNSDCVPRKKPERMAGMISRFLIFMLCAPGVCFASHWCVMKPSKTNAPAYPPIAKAARIQGVVISRLEFDANGNASKVEIVNGSALLAKAVEISEAHWVFLSDTDTAGCQILVISEFSLSESEQANDDTRPWPYTPPGIYRQRIRALFIPPLYTQY